MRKQKLKDTIKICALKYGNVLHYEWDTVLVEENDKYLLVRGEVNRKLKHHTKNAVFTFENPSIEFFPYDEWFTVSVEKAPGNKLNYYCNISMPPTFSGNSLSYIDLDFDYIKNGDGEWTLVDADEFVEHSEKYKYPPELIAKAIEAKDKLKNLIDSHSFPFNGWIESKLD